MPCSDLPRAKSTVVLRDLSTEAMLYDPDGDKIVRLNVTARRIWEMCNGQHDLDQIAAALRAEFEVGADVDPRSDVAQTIDQFAAAGLLTGACENRA
jgi:hypothetical protein